MLQLDTRRRSRKPPLGVNFRVTTRSHVPMLARRGQAVRSDFPATILAGPNCMVDAVLALR